MVSKKGEAFIVWGAWPRSLSLTLFLFCKCILCMGVSTACISVHHMWTWGSRRSEGVRIPGTGVTEDCEPPRGWEQSNPGPRQKQPVLLTVEPCLQLLEFGLKLHYLYRRLIHCLWTAPPSTTISAYRRPWRASGFCMAIFSPLILHWGQLTARASSQHMFTELHLRHWISQYHSASACLLSTTAQCSNKQLICNNVFVPLQGYISKPRHATDGGAVNDKAGGSIQTD